MSSLLHTNDVEGWPHDDLAGLGALGLDPELFNVVVEILSESPPITSPVALNDKDVELDLAQLSLNLEAINTHSHYNQSYNPRQVFDIY